MVQTNSSFWWENNKGWIDLQNALSLAYSTRFVVDVVQCSRFTSSIFYIKVKKNVKSQKKIQFEMWFEANLLKNHGEKKTLLLGILYIDWMLQKFNFMVWL